MRKFLFALLLLTLPAVASAQVVDVPLLSVKRVVLSLGVQERFEFDEFDNRAFEVGGVLGYRLTKNLSVNFQAFSPVGGESRVDESYGALALRWRVWDGAR